MRPILILVFMALLTAIGVRAQKQGKNAEAQVVLRLKTSGGVPPLILSAAKTEASLVLRTAGVRVRWELEGSRSSRETRACLGAVVEVIDVLILERAPQDEHPGALGYAQPFARSGVRVVIYYNRVAAMLRRPNATLMGYTIAHEIGHVLIGTNAHAQTGVMRARWGGDDYSQMTAHLLDFTAKDADMVRIHLADKAPHCLAGGTMGPGTNDRAAGQ
jgi:hypothetical protein